jgi:multicomponent Na+:H+ antiporter subunit E
MKALVLNMLLAVVWVSLTGHFSEGGLLTGFLLGYILLLWLRHLLGPTTYFEKLPRLVLFLVFYLAETVRSNLRVAREVLSLRPRSKSGIIAVPLDLKTDFQISVFTSLLTLTPGSMSLDVSKDRTVLYVHAMFVDDPETFRREVKTQLERRVQELFR